MRVVIMGASKLGITQACLLEKDDYNIVIVDIDHDAFDLLPNIYEGDKVVGSGTDPELLKKMNFGPDDAFVAATTSDNVNIAAVKMVKEKFGCRKTGKVINNPMRAKAFNEVETGIICPVLDAALRFKDSFNAA